MSDPTPSPDSAAPSAAGSEAADGAQLARIEPTGENAGHAIARGLPNMVPDFVEQELQEDIDNIVPSRGYRMTPMVALGGSAGSIQALQEFFRAMPPDSGMIFVVILHLSPNHHSSLPELLGRATTMTVTQAEDGQRTQANHVYVIPPGKHMATTDGSLRLTALEAERGRRVAVDLFFRSLADTHGAHATAVVLSGADGDGAVGLKRIKERGGLTIVQDPDEAEHPSMPRTSIDTGMVDWVLQVKQMPHRLLEYRRNELALRLPAEEGPQPAQSFQTDSTRDEEALRDVLVFLRTVTGRDFTYYKRATIVRRIGRRMQINGVPTVLDYLDFLRTHPGESGALLQDLLISVTNFFRDRDAFYALEAHIPALFEDKCPGDAVRVWVPACATGEEAYSIAILLLEQTRLLSPPPPIQIFACDLDEEAIAEARAGLYTASIAADVGEERLKRFFIKEPRGYRVRREVRETVLFAVHDLLKDAPFSRVELVSCRNLMIYLNREAQGRALDTFHFAVRPGGRLFLGSSESVDEDNPLFNVLDKKHRIYTPKGVARSGMPVTAGTSSLTRLIAAQEQVHATAPTVPSVAFKHEAAPPPPPLPALPVKEPPSLTELHFQLLERLSPPSVIVDREYDIVHLSEHAGRFLQITGGEPTTNLVRLVHPALRVELRSTLYRVLETNAAAEVTGVVADLHGEPMAVDLLVSPAPEGGERYLLVIFKARPIHPGERAAAGRGATPVVPDGIVRQFEREAAQIKAQLRDTVEQYEASTEEMKASNEELQAMNEELRSASEELETSREELQSINEELTAVNVEMKTKMEELAHTNSDLQNLMASTRIATIFLDRELTITRYTPSAADIFYLIPSDAGRPLEHVKLRLVYPEIFDDAGQVLRTLVPVEREVDGDGRWFQVRLQPYRTLEDHIGGVVLTFVDVTERKVAEQELTAFKDKLAADLAGMTRLYNLNERLNQTEGLEEILQEILAVALDFVGAHKGNIQRLGENGETLRLAVHQGHGQAFVEHFAEGGAKAICGAALRSRERLVIEDLTQWPGLPGTEDLRVLLEDGNRAGLSTSIATRRGEVLGMLTAYFAEPHRCSDDAMRRLDLLTWIAADAMERWQVDDALRAHIEELSRFNAVATGREVRMIELKKTINTLALRLGEEPPHRLDFEGEDPER